MRSRLVLNNRATLVKTQWLCFWKSSCWPTYVLRRRVLVRAAFFAAAERDRVERCRAMRLACLDNDCLDAERRLSRSSARFVARERFREGFLRCAARPVLRSRFACRVVRGLPRFGGGSFTPARRALDRPMAIACSGDRAPCSPSRMCSISSRTNSPACVETDLPSRLSFLARLIASSAGTTNRIACVDAFGRNLKACRPGHEQAQLSGVLIFWP